MGKKKRQGEPTTNNSDESTESCDENQNMVECTHINKAIDLQRIKKALLKSDFNIECEECKKNTTSNDLEMDADYEFDLSLWMCLKCGHQGCGRSKKQHALQHFNTPHSDCHAMCVNTTIWSVWCYSCDNEVNITCRKKLLESVEYLKKHTENSKQRNEPSMPSIEDKTIDVIQTNSSEPVIKSSGNNLNLPRTRGLTNLGNTCFFNSVMQCLGQTPYLLNLLEETSSAGQYFQLPGGKLNPEDKDSIILEPLDGTLEEWWPLTRILAQTLQELQNGRPEVYNPRMLFSRLTQRMPQFAGGHQHDSHELLRHLLEAVREEDLRRYQAVILEKMGHEIDCHLTTHTYRSTNEQGLSRKTDPSSVEGDKKKIIKFYGQQASELLLPTEQVFRGVLVSTLQCQECKHTSRRDEFFLDLSLPISEKQIPPILRRKAEESDDNKPSKHQIKKEKRAAKKNKKQKSHSRDHISNSSSQDNSIEDRKENENNSESESDADVEDNIEENSLIKVSASQSKEDIPKGTESGYNSDKVDNGSPDSNNGGGSPDMRVDDSGVPSPAVGMLSVSPLAPDSPENSPASSETNIDMGSPLCGHNSPVEDGNEDYDRPVSRLSFVNNKNIDLKADLEKLSLLNDSDSKRVDSLFSLQTSDSKQDIESMCDDGACGGYDDTQDEKMDEDCDTDVWTSTITARYQCEEGECSVQSCLNQFTACELLTGNNKVGCDLCTKRHGGADKKTVYTNATKQLLVCNPPAVLILHLKRFQVLRFRSAKVNKYVTFPTLLDLAPFCSRRCQNLPSFELGQTKVLYALYGVVEHSGSIHGGHYVAYVKVRSSIDNHSYRWQFLPKNQKQARSEDRGRGAEADPEVPPGKWYYVSDSYVSEVSESKVLKAQAYLLFYERIL